MQQGRNAIIYLVLAGIASWTGLAWIFPRFTDIYWPQHGDFYTPASIANLRLSPIHYRPIGILLDRLRGLLGVRLSIAAGHATVILNTALMGLLATSLRTEAKNMSWPAAGAFLTYALLLFSHPYFFTFSLWDFYSQAALTFTLLAITVYTSSSPTIWCYIVFTLFATLSFLTKETYGLSFLALLALKREDEAWNAWSERRVLTGAALVVGCFIIALLINRHLSSPFIAGSAEATAPYRLSLLPQSIFNQWRAYLMAGFGKTIVVNLLVLGALAHCDRRLAWNAGLFVLAGLAAWLPNSLLPNHYYAGYSWNGATLIFAPTLLLGHLSGAQDLRARRKLFTRGLALTSVWGFLIFKSVDVAQRKDNAWVLQQLDRQKNFYGDLIRLLRERGGDTPRRILLSGITFSFTPLEFPGAFLPERRAAQIELVAVRYGHAHEVAWRNAEKLSYITAAGANPQTFDEIWMVHENGFIQLNKKDRKVTLLPKISAVRAPLFPDLITTSEMSNSAQSFDCLRQEAMTLRRYREFEEAKVRLCQALALRPQDANTWFVLSLTLTDLGEEAGYAATRSIILSTNTEETKAWKQALSNMSGEEFGTLEARAAILSDPCNLKRD